MSSQVWLGQVDDDTTSASKCSDGNDRDSDDDDDENEEGEGDDSGGDSSDAGEEEQVIHALVSWPMNCVKLFFPFLGENNTVKKQQRRRCE